MWVKVRVSDAERAEWHAKARSVGLTLSDLVQGGCRGGRGRRPPGRHRESTLRARRPAGADATRRHMADGPPRGESSTNDLRTSGAVGHGRTRPRNRQGVPMRTPAPKTCAPAGRRKLLCETVLRLAVWAVGAAGLTRTGLGATRQSEGLRRVRGRARLRTPAPAPSGRSQTSNPSRKGVERRLQAAEDPFADWLAAGLFGIAAQGRDAVVAGGSHAVRLRTRFRRTGPCRTACLWRAECRSGVRGCPPARGFRNTKTHLAPRRPANCGPVERRPAAHLPGPRPQLSRKP